MDHRPQDVEIKISFGGQEVEDARKAVGLQPSDGGAMEIWFCEHVQRSEGQVLLGLDEVGLIVRLRRRKSGKRDDSTVKIRRPHLRLPDTWPDGDEDFKFEGDWTASKRQVSASVVTKVPERLITSASLAKGLSPRLFSIAQTEFFDWGGSPRGPSLDSLQPLGPVEALKWDPTNMDGFDRKVAAEQWSVDELRFLELSLRVPLDEAEPALASFAAWAGKVGPTPSAKSKTEQILEHFASQSNS